VGVDISPDVPGKTDAARMVAALERIANVLEHMYLADAAGEIVFSPAEDEPIRES
jgi:hypothetical protein